MQKRNAIIILSLLLSQSIYANSGSQICTYARDRVSVSIDDTTAHVGQPIYVHYTTDIDLHYVWRTINTVTVERNRFINDARVITKSAAIIPDEYNDYIKHEDTALQYDPLMSAGTYNISYRVYIPARECDLREYATLTIIP
jgi:hypothetical protein